MFASTPKHLLNRPRLMHALVALAAASLIVAAVVIQKVDGLEPCPLCILQRYAFTFVAALAALRQRCPAAPRPRPRCCPGVVAAGAAVAAWHVRLQLFPPEESSCGPSLQYLLSNLPLGRALPGSFRLRRLHPDRLDLPEVVDAGWSFLWLIALGGMLVFALRRPR